MNNGGATRIKYTTGQFLTAQDFTDQQEYHRNKQKLLLQRFPHGIIGGLKVKCEPKKDDDPNDFDGFRIEPGLAVDRISREIAVPAGGFKVRTTAFIDPDEPYLSLVYDESEELVGDVICGVNQKNNRINETFKPVFDPAPNMGDHVTVALIELKVGMKPGPCENYDVHLEDKQGGPRIRLDAGLIGSDQISNGAITEEKIKNGTVTLDKLSDTVKEQFVTGGDSHDHDQGDGAPIPKGGLHADVLSELVTGGNSHDHSSGDGATIPEAGLEQAVTNKLVTGGDGHNHTGAGGATIPEAGLEQAVTNKLVTGGNSHDHTGVGGATIPEAGLHQGVKDRLVTGGDSHDHSGVGGAAIPETGLQQTVKDKLVTGGNSHDHSGGDGAAIPETGLQQTVKDKLVTGGNSHDHSGGGGAAIPETGLQQAVKDKLVPGGSLHDHTAGHGAVIPLAGLHADVQGRLVTGGNGHNHVGGNGALITKDAIDTGAVTSDKLKVISNLANGTVSVGTPAPVTVNGVSPNAIIQVIPTSAGELSWTYVLQFGSITSLNYKISVTNTGAPAAPVVAFQVRAITFN
jgi:hypothetical protein